MTVAATSHHVLCAAVQKPIPRKTLHSGVICGACLLSLLSCGTTPIDAVVAEGAREQPAVSPACNQISAGRFILSLEMGCLRRGEATTVYGEPGFLTELSADCVSVRAQWDVTPALAGTFTVRNVDNQLSLDVRAASDLPGTPVIVFAPNTLDNQRFWFRPRADATLELAPRHAPTLCVSARAGSVSMQTCEADEPAQAFLPTRVGCK
jgi:hypothetical protein